MKSNAKNQSSIKQLRQSEPLKRKSLMRMRIIKYGLSNFARNGWLSLAAIAVMSFTLLTVFVAGVATVALNDTIETTKTEKMDLSLYMRPDTPENMLNDLKTSLESESNVTRVDIVSKADAVKKITIDDETRALIEENGEKLEDILPRQVSIHVRDIANIDSMTELVNGDGSLFRPYLDANSLEKQFFQGESQRTVQNMTNLANTVQLIGFILGGVFLVITILVTFNTIRLAIFARRDEIEIEKLIGAEKSYVRGPFLVEAELYGIISAIIALGVGYALIISFVPEVLTGETVSGVSMGLLNQILIGFWPLVVVGVLFVGIMIGSLSARLAVKKYLKY